MPVVEKIGRRNSIPILYTRGTHYEVGFDVGRTFSSLIHSFLAASPNLNKALLPLYETDAGKKVYEETLTSVRKNFPQYVREMEGTADGAQVPFHKEILGHTEDALAEVLNHFYFVSAHIISDLPQGRWKVTEERFTSLCYAGHLPGYTMSYNHHGFVYSVNVISAKILASGKTPRYFLTRALLAAENFAQAQEILRDSGCGAGDAVSINMTFLNQEGDRLFHNAEVGPPVGAANESSLSIFTASPGEHIFHCNKYLRLQIPEAGGEIMTSSDHRHAAMKCFPHPASRKDVINILGDQSNKEYSIFQESGDDDYVKTVAVGIFDCVRQTWSIYTDNPKTNEPVVVLPLQLKSPAK